MKKQVQDWFKLNLFYFFFENEIIFLQRISWGLQFYQCGPLVNGGEKFDVNTIFANLRKPQSLNILTIIVFQNWA
jgi:hypothetical protein